MLTARTDAVPSARSPLIVDSDARSSPTLPVVSVPAGEAAASPRARRREFDAIEGERQRLARELHDETGYRLTVATLSLDAIAECWGTDAELRARLGALRQLIRECSDSFHDIAFNLHPRILTDLGLAPAIRCLVRKVQAASEAKLSVEIQGAEHRLGEPVELAAFRLVQESLTNAAKYARAANIGLHIEFLADGARIAIADDGIGFDAVHDDERSRRGLNGMHERVEAVGGTIRVESQPGHGTRVLAWLPRMDVV